MTLDLLRLAKTGNLAPSVHNTQPTRWSLRDDGALWLTADPRRQLAIGDAAGRDLRISMGAALEGTILALGQAGQTARVIDLPDDTAAARLELAASAAIADPLSAQLPQRCTWRRGFVAARAEQRQALSTWASEQGDITMVADPTEIAVISRLNEITSLDFYRNTAYRHELLTWMRLAPSDPRYGIDGLSASALGMSRFEAFGARLVLSDPGFAALDLLRLVAPLISEKSRTASASAVLLFHRPADENPINTGRALYRRLLELSALGLQAWPMSVLADNAESAAEITDRYGVGDQDRLITVLRVGILPPGAAPKRERLPADALIAV